MQSTSTGRRPVIDISWRRGRSDIERSKGAWGVLFTLPVVAYIAIFWVYPAIKTVSYSFTNFDLVRQERVGLDNYRFLFEDPDFSNSIRVTLLFAILSLVPTIVLALLIAVPLSQHRTENGALRALYFVPAILPLISAAVLWQIIFASSGLMNSLLDRVGLSSVEWLTSPDVALWSLVIMVVWKQLGLFVVIYIAGLQSIPESVYQAASIDGSRTFRTFFRITLPLMQRTLLFTIVIATIGAMQSFVPAYIMFPSRGGPEGSVNVLPLYLYENAFVFTRMGYASTIAVVLFAILVVLSVVQFRILRSRPA